METTGKGTGTMFRANNLPTELALTVRPANRPDLHVHVAERVADFCYENGITEAMIQDIRMAEMEHGYDEAGTFSQIRVRLIYR
jgi:hypothetical protein